MTIETEDLITTIESMWSGVKINVIKGCVFEVLGTEKECETVSKWIKAQDYKNISIYEPEDEEEKLGYEKGQYRVCVCIDYVGIEE